MPPSTLPIAFATYTARPGGEPDDLLAVEAVEARGAPVVRVPWDVLDPADYRAIVLRSTWDYFHRLSDFLAWIGRVEASGVPMFNGADTVRGNVDKRYLRALEAAGVPVVPTAWPTPGDRLAYVLAAHSWADAVVKPAVSGGAFETFRVAAGDAAGVEDRFAALLARGTVLVQPFLPEIETDGEFSFLFIDGAFSHAVLKRPRAGDFRVQAHLGGTTVPFAASDALVGEAAAVLRAAGGAGLLYARIDGLVRGGRFELMEAELTEPAMFFEQDAASPARFADALLARLG